MLITFSTAVNTDNWLPAAHIHVIHAVKMKLFCAHGQNFEFLVNYKSILPFIMMVKYFNLDKPKQRNTNLTFMVLKNMKWRNPLSKFGVYN